MSSRGMNAAEAAMGMRRSSRRGSANVLPSSNNNHAVAVVPEKKAKLLRIKIITMGDCATGKSCIVKRFCEERFVSKYISTIGIDYGVKPTKVGGRDVRVNFWDMSGSPEFFEVRNEFYKDASGALLVYDVSNRSSFENLQMWIEEAKKFGAGNCPKMICANKIDKKRVVQEAEGMQFAAANGLQHWETSSSSGANIVDVFETLFKTIMERPPVG